jgi:hypothetical protein
MSMKKHGTGKVTVSMKKQRDGTVSGRMEGSAADMGEMMERFGRGVGYGQELARQHDALLESSTKAIKASNSSMCAKCFKSINASTEIYYCQCSV